MTAFVKGDRDKKGLKRRIETRQSVDHALLGLPFVAGVAVAAVNLGLSIGQPEAQRVLGSFNQPLETLKTGAAFSVALRVVAHDFIMGLLKSFGCGVC